MASNRGTRRTSNQNRILSTGRSLFCFQNGDAYWGNFVVNHPNSVWRSGYGKYFTNDGAVYTGEWNLDELKEGSILHPNGHVFLGRLNEGKYTGAGSYIVPGLGEIKCRFRENKFEDKTLMTLIDVNGNKWRGETCDGRVELIPENHFFWPEPEQPPNSLETSSSDYSENSCPSLSSQSARLSKPEL